MFKFVFLLIVILFFFYSNVKKKGWITSSNWLFFIYVLSAACAILDLKYDEMTDVQTSEYWGPMIEFICFLLLFLLPFKRFQEQQISSIVLPNRKILDLFSSFIIVISFYTIIYYASTVRNIFALASLGDARTAVYLGEVYTDTGIMNTIASVGGSLYVFALLLYFIYSAIGDCKRRAMLLLISSVSEPIHILTCVGRDGIVFWIFTFGFLFLFFYQFIAQDFRKSILKSFIIGACLLLLPFMAISISRFGEDSVEKYDTGSSLVVYMGQGPVYAVTYFGIDEKRKPMENGSSFPLYYEITKQPMPKSMGMVQVGQFRSWAFATFIVGLYSQFGLWWFLAVLIFYLIHCGLVLGRGGRTFRLNQMMIYLLYFQILSQGVFYFKQYTRGGNLFIVICFLLCFVFKTLEKDGNNVVLERNRY